MIWCTHSVVYSWCGVLVVWYTHSVVYSWCGVLVVWCTRGVVYSWCGVLVVWFSAYVYIQVGLRLDPSLDLDVDFILPAPEGTTHSAHFIYGNMASDI